MKIIRKTALLLILGSLAACGGGSSGSSGSVSSLAGTYAWPDSGDGDEGYIIIASNGDITDYDYAGDAFDNSGNCYWIAGPEHVAHASGSTYTITEDAETYTVDIIQSNSGLTITGTDEDGPYTITFSKVNLLASDFTPEC